MVDADSQLSVFGGHFEKFGGYAMQSSFAFTTRNIPDLNRWSGCKLEAS